jgi:hypothetical protein
MEEMDVRLNPTRLDLLQQAGHNETAYNFKQSSDDYGTLPYR